MHMQKYNHNRGRLNIKMQSDQYRNAVMNIRRSYDRLFFIMESQAHTSKNNLYIKTGPQMSHVSPSTSQQICTLF